MRLMCDRKLDFAGLSRTLGLNFADAYAREIAGLADLQTDGLLQQTSAGIEVTALGVPLLRVIAMRFDPHFVAGPRRHAQAI